MCRLASRIQVQDTVVGVARTHISLEMVGHMDHEPRQVRRMGDSRDGDVHEVFEPLGLFSVPAVTLDVAPQAMVVREGRVRQGQGTTQQDDMSPCVGVQVRLGGGDDMQGWANAL
jgi:hypothetical protein